MAEMRKCVGSTRFGIEPHLAPVEDFPLQPSQKDGLGRICKTHWNQYTAGLARDAKSRKAGPTNGVEAVAPVAVTQESDMGTPETSVTGPAVTEEAATMEPAPKRRRSKPALVAEGEESAS